MGLKTSMRKGFGSGLNPKKWIGFDLLAGTTKTVLYSAKTLFGSRNSKVPHETFENAVQRMQLSENDLKKRMRSAKQLITVFILFSITLFLYSIYHFSKTHIADGFICLILTLLTLAYASREHFYLFQMQRKKLGCSYKEWLLALLPNKK